MSGYQDQEEQQNGLRRRGKNNGNRKSTNMNKDEKSRPTSVLLGRNSTIIEANPRDDEGESDLDAPLIGGGGNSDENANENVRILNDSQNGASPSAGGRRSIAIGCNSANNDGSGSGANLRGTLTTTNNGAWNRLSCVSTMLATCLGTAASSTSPPGSPAGCTSASASSFDGNNNSNGNSGNNNNKSGVLTTAVDVACAIVDKLPKFMANKLGPNSRKLEPKQQNFVDGLRAAFAVPYNRSDAAHVAIVKDLYRHYYALCCRDADPLIDTAAYIDHFSPSCGSHFGADARIGGSAAADGGGGEERRWGGPSPSGVNEEGKEEAEEDPISSEFWKLIGFQGTNPGTDFRGGGVLSLLLLLHLFRSRPDLVRSIFTAREAAPNTPPPPKAQSTASTTSSADPDFHFAPPFFVVEMTEHITAATASSSSNSASAITDVEAAARGGGQFLTCDYPFAIAAINVAMHQMLLLGLETKTTCMATTDNIGSFSARLASSKLLKIAMDDNGNCASHAEHPSSCRPHLRRLVATYRGGKSAISTSFSAQPSPASPTRDPHQHLYDGFDHLAAVFETAIAVMHNEWDILPPPEKNILFFNQVLQRAREKTEVMLRRCDNILALGRSVEGYSWVTY